MQSYPVANALSALRAQLHPPNLFWVTVCHACRAGASPQHGSDVYASRVAHLPGCKVRSVHRVSRVEAEARRAAGRLDAHVQLSAGRPRAARRPVAHAQTMAGRPCATDRPVAHAQDVGRAPLGRHPRECFHPNVTLTVTHGFLPLGFVFSLTSSFACRCYACGP